MIAGDVDARVYVRRCDEGDELFVCVLVCEICTRVWMVLADRERAWPAYASTVCVFQVRVIPARRRLRSPSNTALISPSSPLLLSPGGWQAQASD